MVYLGRYADAEDVTQEVFVRLLYRSPAFADESHKVKISVIFVQMSIDETGINLLC